MLFNSLTYLTLLFITRLIVLNYGKLIKGWLLVLASVIFYSFAGLNDLILAFTLISLNWVLVNYFTKARIFLAIVLNIGALVFIKYWDFFFSTKEFHGSFVDVTLPLGISFYTFQMLAYHIDACKKKTEEASGIEKFFLFVLFFPQLIAGPIVRAGQLIPQIERFFSGVIKENRLITFGLGLICLGLVKKVILADSLAPIVDEIFENSPKSTFDAWLGAYLFGFQIYFDFSGYADIAVGSAYLIGFRIPFNFRYPYLSKSPKEFWQRWHITLSTWIRDYFYIPLGGSKENFIKSSLILIFVMSIAGLWHGANLTFVLWGFFWSIYIIIVRIFNKFNFKNYVLLTWPIHFAIVCLLWVLFRSSDITNAINYIHVMFSMTETASDFNSLSPISSYFLPLIGCSFLFFIHFLESCLSQSKILYFIKKHNNHFVWGLFTALIIIINLIPQPDSNPFIYFRF